MPQANTSTSGYLSFPDWNAFFNKVSSVGPGAGITIGGTPTTPTVAANFAGSGTASTVSHSDHNHYGATWTGLGTRGLTVTNSSGCGALVGIAGSDPGAGPCAGVIGYGSNSAPGVLAQSGSGFGVDASSTLGVGLRVTGGTDGIDASASHDGNSAIFAHTGTCTPAGPSCHAWAGFFGGDVRTTGGLGVGAVPASGWAPGLTSSGPIRAGTGGSTNCDVYLADDICFFDEQNATLSVRDTTGVFYAPVRAASFLVSSDRALKGDVRKVDSGVVLRALAGLPIQTWSFKSDANHTRHLGPMAQDFAKAFHLGAGNKSIDLIDGQGVSMAAIKALYAISQKQQRQIATLQAQVRALKHSR
jgi:hypothetical protein